MRIDSGLEVSDWKLAEEWLAYLDQNMLLIIIRLASVPHILQTLQLRLRIRHSVISKRCKREMVSIMRLLQQKGWERAQINKAGNDWAHR